MRLPHQLGAPEPGWDVETDVVVGSGIAGLITALYISRQSALRVLLVTKDVIVAGSTRWGAGRHRRGDSPERHFADTILAGAGVCDDAAVPRSCARVRPRCASSSRWARVSTARTTGSAR